MPTNERALIVFMKYPEAGKVKSRLASAVGDFQAARIYEKLVRRTLGIVSDFLQHHPSVKAHVFFSPVEKWKEVEKKFSGPWNLMAQQGSHLGDRMGKADQSVRSLGFERVVLIGTDLPFIEPGDLEEAFRALDDGYAVLGPAADGGFYLIGLDQPCPSVFEREVWGTNDILSRTEILLLRAGHRVFKTQCRADLDRGQDLLGLKEQRLFEDRLSVVIPTLSPIERLGASLDYLNSQIWPGDEIIVAQGVIEKDWARLAVKTLPAPAPGGIGNSFSLVQPHRATIDLHRETASDRDFKADGGAPREQEGSSPVEEDRSRAESSSGTVRHVISPQGRGIQLNSGAAVSEGSLLLFLHDDSLPPQGFPYAIRKTCALPGFSLGCFQLAFSPSSPSLKLVSRWANFRSRRLRLPYGDQGLFCCRDLFERVGGFRRPFLMEDVDFVRRCRQLGRIVVLPQRIETSSQRYLQKGVLRASMQNHMLMLLYLLGVDDEKLYAIYYRS